MSKEMVGALIVMGRGLYLNTRPVIEDAEGVTSHSCLTNSSSIANKRDTDKLSFKYVSKKLSARWFINKVIQRLSAHGFINKVIQEVVCPMTR